jgi:hypothetical protein
MEIHDRLFSLLSLAGWAEGRERRTGEVRA